MTIRVAINGFGRIGRVATRLAEKRSDIEVVAINALNSVEDSAHLFKYDSVHGVFDGEVKADGDKLFINGRSVATIQQRDPAEIEWAKYGADIVLECTGAFVQKDKAALHMKGGAKKVIISAPGKEVDGTFCVGINDKEYDPANHHIISNASCTTNALAPIAKVLNDKFKIVKGLMTTIHSYTNDQRILDQVHSDMRRARAGAVNMIPTSTGAAKAIGLVLPQLKGKLDGFAMRVPTPNVSVVDLTAELEKPTSKDELNAAMKAAAEGELKGVLRYSDEPLVSMDFNGDTHSSSFDAPSTLVTDGNMVKVVSWYDNECGYSQRLLDLATIVGKSL